MAWTLDRSHSTVGFSIRHLVFSKVRGRFRDFGGAVELDGDAPVSVTATVQAASIDTAEADRDAHLRSPDFFDAESFPTLSFASTRLATKGAGAWALTGDLTIHGVTKEVTFEVTTSGRAKDPWGNERIAFEGTTRINRKDFGLTWSQTLETGGLLVGEDVDISLEVQAVRGA